MPSEYYSIDELLVDESFARYTLFNSAQDRKQWEIYLQNHPDQQPIILEAQQTLALVHESLKEKEEEKQLQQFKMLVAEHKVTDETGEYENIRKMPVSIVRSLYRYVAAAVVLVIISFGVIWLFHQKKSATEIASVSSIPITYQKYACAVGERKTILLPDGTHVILNSNSTLNVPDDFKTNRHVSLDGAAFFDVVHMAQNPFKVSAKNLVTIDIGTSFLVRAYDYEPDIKVLLLSGKVRVETHINRGKEALYNTIELNPGQDLTLNNKNGQLQTGTFNISALENWKAGNMVFNNASFDEVLQRLQQWYGVEFDIRGNHQKIRHFTGQFDHEKLDSVLKVISFSMNCTYKIEGNKVIMIF